MQENQAKAVQLRVRISIFHLGAVTNIPMSRGNSSDTTSLGATDGLLGNFDAKVKGRSKNVLETGVL